MDPSANTQKIIENLRSNIENIHKAKHSRWSKELASLLVINKSLIMQLRRSQRELAESIENSKVELTKSIEKTDDMHTKLEELKYEKVCIENEIRRIKNLDTQELACLGISITGDKAKVLNEFKLEQNARERLQGELRNQEELIKDATIKLGVVDAKIKNLLEGLKKVEISADYLTVLVDT